jgi:phosphoserine phosphatase
MMLLPRTDSENAERVRQVVRPLAAGSAGRPVFLVDADRTLTPEDTSRVFLRRAGLDPLVIKRRFQRDGYCFDAFRFHAEMHVELGVDVFDVLAPGVARDTVLHEGVAEFLRAASEAGAVFIVSAGIPAIWREVVRQHALYDVGVIGGIDPRLPFVFGKAEKSIVFKEFQRVSPVIVGVGDSEVDAGMLGGAQHAVVVVNHRANVDLLPHLEGHPSVWQVAPVHPPHAGIPHIAFPDVAQLVERSPCP